jgi:flavin reductase
MSELQVIDAVDEEQRAAQALRQDARRLPTGVSVLTVGEGKEAHGATVSAVSVVSQQPPSVCAAVRYDSVLARIVLETGTFVVNVLSSGQALLADWFANPQRPAGRDQFAPVRWEPQEETGIPLLHGCLAHLTCALVSYQRVGKGDGLLVAQINSTTLGTGRPLVSYDGRLFDPELHGVARRRGWRPAESTVSSWD